MATLEKFYSDVVLGGVQSSDLGWSFEEATVTVTAASTAGMLLEVSGTKLINVVDGASTTEADAVAVLVDVRVDQGDGLAAGDHVLVVAKRGVTVNKNYVKMADGTTGAAKAASATAIAAFEAAGANKVTDKVFGTAAAVEA
jgi:hypothetical protein